MKISKILGIVIVAVILSLLGVTIPATPALAQPTVTLSPTSGSIGTKVTVTGINFESFKNTDINIFFNDLEIEKSPITVPDNGRFTTDLTIPEDAAPGTANVMVKTSLGGEIIVPFTILGAEIELTPKDGPVGTTITINGSGFYAGKTVNFYYDGTNILLGSEEATSRGECSYSFPVPESTAGNHRIVAQGSWGSWAEVNFKVIPSVFIDPESGAIGDTVTVIGTGFGEQSRVTIYFNEDRITTTKTDTDGSLDVNFDVPIIEAGTYDVLVEDREGNSEEAEFTIAAGAKLEPTMGYVGATLTASGIGFKASGIVTINYDEAQIATTTANASGAFSVTFKAPTSIGGTHTITITDGDNTIKHLFNMESTSPSAPKPLLPKDADKTEVEVVFDWEDVKDDSGVTYTLQIASDADFTAIILEKSDLTYSDYNVMGVEELRPTEKEAPYHWRVKAVDGAFNESEWSTSKSLYVVSSSGLPDWAKYVLIIVGVLVAGFLAFWLGRRTAFRQ